MLHKHARIPIGDVPALRIGFDVLPYQYAQHKAKALCWLSDGSIPGGRAFVQLSEYFTDSDRVILNNGSTTFETRCL